MIVIEEMAGMDIFCSDKIGIFILNRLTVDKSIIEVLLKRADKELVLFVVVRVFRTEN